MRSKKLKTDDIIRVTWVDQNSYTTVTQAKGAINSCLGSDVGHFLEENKDWICLAMERMDCQNSEVGYRHTVSIPKCCIKKIEILKKGKK